MLFSLEHVTWDVSVEYIYAYIHIYACLGTQEGFFIYEAMGKPFSLLGKAFQVLLAEGGVPT